MTFVIVLNYFQLYLCFNKFNTKYMIPKMMRKTSSKKSLVNMACLSTCETCQVQHHCRKNETNKFTIEVDCTLFKAIMKDKDKYPLYFKDRRNLEFRMQKNATDAVHVICQFDNYQMKKVSMTDGFTKSTDVHECLESDFKNAFMNVLEKLK